MKRIPRTAIFLNLTEDGDSVYMTDDYIITRRQRKPPFHSTVVRLLIDLYRVSRDDYESIRRGERDLSEVFVDPRLLGYPEWCWLHGNLRYRFKPVARYFISVDAMIGNAHDHDDGDDSTDL